MQIDANDEEGEESRMNEDQDVIPIVNVQCAQS